jgi:tetratricopeptide (TPR) repeat protein
MAQQTEDKPDESGSPQKIHRPFFTRTDWIAFSITFLVTLAVYVYTVAPTVTLEDSGELAVAADYLGVPHPPGYPIWTLVTWFFQWVFHWVDYNGHPNPAWSVGLMSAVFGALTCGIMTMLICRSGSAMIRSLPKVEDVLGESSERIICLIGAVTGGLMLAFSPGLWSQSVIVEVYSFNTFFLAIVLLFAYRWMCRPADERFLYLTAFLFGLGLTNHQTLLFCGIALAAMVLFRDPELFRDFLIVGVGILAIFVVNIFVFKANEIPELMWKAGPGHASFWIQNVLFVAIPVLGMILLPRGKVVGITYLVAMLGVCFYLYLPFASEGNPPMNWAYPRTWEGFLHSITRGQYEKIQLSNVLGDPQKFIAQLGSYFRDLRLNFAISGALLAFLPFTTFNITLKGRKIRAFYVSGALALVAMIIATFTSLIGMQTGMLVMLYKFLSVLILGIAVLGVTNIVTRYAIDEIKAGGLASILVIFALGAAAALLVYLDINLLKFFFDENTSEASRLLMTVMVALPIVLIGMVYWMTIGAAQMTYETRPRSQRWLLVTIAAFLSLSVILVIFLNPKLDIQTLFIQRVQLIQSHAVYALWVGYGVILTLAILETALGGQRWVKGLGIVLAVTMPLASLSRNYFLSEERAKIVGGCEQNGHDFGWQFGNWQLRGVEGIKEDLFYDNDEDPEKFNAEWAEYPNPDYPPAMDTNAIFYGGTDPGRFVPTYMIYSADVRADVFLITQNALADNTYMNVMRDLYGDEIWIPSQQDSNSAFQKYVKDVQDGTIQAGADVNIKGGRVSVQGVQGVMAINGILARYIFDANKHKHSFYIEESYVIPWMYPYLEPHGLIMKINKEPIEITEEMVKNDRDFWDWYTARLMGNEKFLRDIVARKTFSKLRSAMAGLYGYRRNFAEAEHAFRQAIDLYPLSPEANFRLANIYMQQRRFLDAREVMAALAQGDPGNDKVTSFLKQIVDTETLDLRRQELEKIYSAGSPDINGAVELCQTYLRLGLLGNFQGLALRLLNEDRVPPNVYLTIGQMFSQIKRMDLIEVALTRYLTREETDSRRWLDLAVVQAAQKKNDPAFASLEKAVKIGGPALQELARKDTRLNVLHSDPRFEKLVPSAPANINFPIGGF